MADADNLRPYTPRDYPIIEGSEARWISDELKRISASISSIRSVLQELEARIVALEP